MVFNTTFNNISVLSWRSVLLMDETGENHQHVASNWHNVVLSTPRHEWGLIRVITKLQNSKQSYKGKVKTHKHINRQSQSTTGKLWKP